MDVWRSRLGEGRQCPGERLGQRCGFQRLLSRETRRRNVCSEGEEREAGRTLGPAVPLGGGERGETNVCVSLPFLAWWPGSCSLCSVLRCSLVGGGRGAETLLRREVNTKSVIRKVNFGSFNDSRENFQYVLE